MPPNWDKLKPVNLQGLVTAVFVEMPTALYNEFHDQVDNMQFRTSALGVNMVTELGNMIVDYGSNVYGRTTSRFKHGFRRYGQQGYARTLLINVLTLFPLTGLFAGKVIGTFNERLGREIYVASGQGLIIRSLEEFSHFLLPEDWKVNVQRHFFDRIDSFLTCAWTQCYSWMTGHKKKSGKPVENHDNIEYLEDKILMDGKPIVALPGAKFLENVISKENGKSINKTARLLDEIKYCVRCYRTTHLVIQCDATTTKDGRKL